VAGAGAGLWFGERVYEAETVLLYRRAADASSEIGDSTFLATHMNMVEIPSNLQEVRRRLDLPVSVQELGGAVDARIEAKTGLLILRSTWADATTVADVANTLREVFVEHHVEVMGREELESLDARLEESRAEKREAEAQLAQLEVIEKETRLRVEEDLLASPELEGLGDVNIRIERIRDAIFDDQNQRANVAELVKWELEYERARSLAEQGVISKSELDRLRSEYERQEALTVDTDQTRDWRSELERLQEVAMPAGSATSPAAPVLQEMLLRGFLLRLDQIRLDERLRQLGARRAEVVVATRLVREDVAVGDAALAGLNYFRLISPAEQPVHPIRSNRRLLALSVAMLVGAAGLGALAFVELGDTRLRTEADAELKLHLPCWASFVEGEVVSALASRRGGAQSQGLASRLRRRLPEPGLVLGLVSETEGEQRPEVTEGLARALASQGESVLLIEASAGVVPTVERPDDARDTGGWLRVLSRQRVREARLSSESGTSATGDARPGLAELLEDRDTRLEDVILETDLSGVKRLPAGPRGVDTATLAGPRLAQVLSDAAVSFDCVLVDLPAAERGARTELIARHCGAVLLVASGGGCAAGRLRARIAKLRSTGIEPLAVVATQLPNRYQKSLRKGA
jgi:Mrp family chromosome partitioning ATPase